MSQVSKRLVAKDIEKRMEEILWDSSCSLRSSKNAKLFLSDLLTPTEKIVLAKRLAIAVLLSKGYDNEAIMGILKVSSSTVAKIKLALGGEGYKMVLGKFLRKEVWKEFLEGIDKIWYKMYPYAQHPSEFRPKKVL